MKVDSSRCVACFNCIDACKETGMHYRLPRRGESLLQKMTNDGGTVIAQRARNAGVQGAKTASNASRRRFLSAVGITGIAASRLIADKTLSKKELTSSEMNYVPELGIELGPKRDIARTKPIMPPGAFDFRQFTEKCTSCHLCVAKCPAQVIKPAFLEYGVGGMFQPMMNFDNHFCNYDCTICSDVCPTDALIPLSKDDKHHNQMGVVQLYLENCIVYTDETSCGACSEHCPTQAVHMVHYKDSLTIPKIEQAICVGCGGCEYVCPAKPWKAIFVEGKPVHERIELEFEEVEETKVDDFGF